MPEGVPEQPGATGRGYRIERLIGTGGAAVVYEARRLGPEGPGARVACKLVHTQRREESRQYELVWQEALLGLRVAAGHPNVVEILDFFHDAEQQLCIVMELVEGASAAELRGPELRLPAAIVRRIAADVLAGLAHVHGRGVLHRDVSLRNVLVSVDGIAKLTDFGIARELRDGKVETATLRGTPMYLSPEAIHGLAADVRADLFMLGAVLYDLVTGAPPCGHQDMIGPMLARNVKGDFAPLPPDTPADLAELITGLIEVDRDRRRPGTAAETLALLRGHGQPMASRAELAELVAATQERREQALASVRPPKVLPAGYVLAQHRPGAPGRVAGRASGAADAPDEHAGASAAEHAGASAAEHAGASAAEHAGASAAEARPAHQDDAGASAAEARPAHQDDAGASAAEARPAHQGDLASALAQALAGDDNERARELARALAAQDGELAAALAQALAEHGGDLAAVLSLAMAEHEADLAGDAVPEPVADPPPAGDAVPEPDDPPPAGDAVPEPVADPPPAGVAGRMAGRVAGRVVGAYAGGVPGAVPGHAVGHGRRRVTRDVPAPVRSLTRRIAIGATIVACAVALGFFLVDGFRREPPAVELRPSEAPPPVPEPAPAPPVAPVPVAPVPEPPQRATEPAPPVTPVPVTPVLDPSQRATEPAPAPRDQRPAVQRRNRRARPPARRDYVPPRSEWPEWVQR